VARYTYDLAIIGGGTAGLLAATTAKLLGARAVMIEGEHVGGDCTWTGCVPSKSLVAAAKAAHHARTADRFGVHADGVRVDFGAVMQHVRHTVADIYHDESPEALRADGIEVIEAFARFTDPHTLALSNGQTLTAKNILLATGASPIVPAALADLPHLTNRTLFNLTTLPDPLIIIGAGPAGVEMAQAFRRLGARVSVVAASDQVLPRDDAEAGVLVAESLRAEGVTLHLGAKDIAYARALNGVRVAVDGHEIGIGTVLAATGRSPNLAKLGLEAAGVQVDANGKLVLTPTLRTTAPHIYAAGDVVGGQMFTHTAGYHGYIAARNALLPVKARANRPAMWATFTDPEVAHAGLTEAEAITRFGAGQVQVTRLPMSRSDRAQTEANTRGFLKAVHHPNGKLLGVTVVGLHAADLLTEWATLLWRGGNIGDSNKFVRPYPNFATVNGSLGLSFTRRTLPTGATGALLRGLVRLFNR
jgi:pyruvate/2-oxoglutarate dehydrogenase complex dihydrolipoamide dehydrogenase (E3) component